MGAFAEMFPGRTPERKARDEDSQGQDHLPRIPDGPLDLDSGVLRLEPRRAGGPAASQADSAADGTDESG